MPTEAQQEIVAEIEAEQSLVAANRELVRADGGKDSGGDWAGVGDEL